MYSNTKIHNQVTIPTSWQMSQASAGTAKRHKVGPGNDGETSTLGMVYGWNGGFHGKITIFHGKTHYKWWFSIVMFKLPEGTQKCVFFSAFDFSAVWQR